MKYVIAGGSIAAYTAYQEIKCIDSQSEVKVISKETVMPYGKMLLPYLLSGNILKSSAFYRIDENDIVLNDALSSIDTVNKFIKTRQGEVFGYDKLLIATGADAYTPDYEGNYPKESVAGVRYIQDLERINIALAGCSRKNIILIGAGMVTLEVGWALVKLGFSVTYIVSSKWILSQILDEDAAILAEKHIAGNYNVKFIKEDDVGWIDQYSEGLHIKLKSGAAIDGCFIVVGKGVKPNTDFFDDKDFKKGIEVDSFLETRYRDIYAAGDVSVFNDVVDGVKKMHAIWPVAVDMAKCAAKNMAGIKSYYMPEFTRNILPVFDLNIFTGGISNKNKYDVFVNSNDSEYRKVILKDGIIQGFSFIGDIKNYGAYNYLAKRKKNVLSYIDKMLYGSVDINYKK
jgi:NAD(P)H-nitrite reductase large subunit